MKAFENIAEIKAEIIVTECAESTFTENIKRIMNLEHNGAKRFVNNIKRRCQHGII